MSECLVLADALSIAHECRTAAELERELLGCLEREVGLDVAFFATKGDEAAPTVLGIDAASVAYALARPEVYGEDLLPVKRAALARRGVAVDTDVLGVEGVRRTRYHRELASKVGGRH